MSKLTDILEFRIADGYYAIDVQIAREIVEMMTITPPFPGHRTMSRE
ncbi:hypothetical protein [Methanogenium cariaci]|nr:hypothetical protein [Methanogenium cariaci]